ncbi:hypothetical protein [Microbacterium sp. Leaf320]|uniref:hypothetical protein n=1 Tax=Microbacterium sp. Leaf320 TaxID=1736334 RepID=UPI0006FDECB7|nr:hypothetical protein [Microbacterium sp. Leaf320]KQQ65187.1 hypothetical protein ASF63_14615 [Microbacterium sp. Leaf320]
MVDNIDPVPFLIALALIVAAWLALGIRDHRRGRIVEAALTAALADRVDQGICALIWLGDDSGLWVVCSRPLDHTGPHVNHRTGDLDRGR